MKEWAPFLLSGFALYVLTLVIAFLWALSPSLRWARAAGVNCPESLATALAQRGDRAWVESLPVRMPNVRGRPPKASGRGR